jgi:hypothetical protein
VSIEPVNLAPQTVEVVRGIATRQAVEAADQWRTEQVEHANRRAVMDFLGVEIAPRHQIPRAAQTPSGRPGVITQAILWVVLVLTVILAGYLGIMGAYLWMTR